MAGGAAFEAVHLWEKRQQAEGKPVSHSFAKEAIAALAGAEVDKLFETKGLDFIDREKAKHSAKENAKHIYDQQYADQDQYDPYVQSDSAARRRARERSLTLCVNRNNSDVSRYQ